MFDWLFFPRRCQNSCKFSLVKKHCQLSGYLFIRFDSHANANDTHLFISIWLMNLKRSKTTPKLCVVAPLLCVCVCFLVTQTICMSGTNENERQCQMAELIVVKHGRSISVTHIFEFKRIYDKISRNSGTRGKRKKTNLNVASMAMVTKWLRIRLESKSVSCNKAGM